VFHLVDHPGPSLTLGLSSLLCDQSDPQPNKNPKNTNKKKKTKLVYVQKKSPLTKGTSPGDQRPRPFQSARYTPPSGTTSNVTLGRCGANYFHALYDPFTVRGEVCIPGQLAGASRKLTVVSRGQFSLGTAGCGGVAYWPFRMLTSDVFVSGLNYFPAIIATGPTYAEDSTNFRFTNSYKPVADSTVTYTGGLTSEYTTASLGVGTDGTTVQRNARLVAAGIRVSYEGKEVDRSGQYICWQNPMPKATVNAAADDISRFLALNQAARVRVMDSGTAGITYMPRSEADFTYPIMALNYDTDATYQASIVNRLAGAIFIVGGQNLAPYTFEAYAHFEVQGAGITTTPTSTDVESIGIATGAGAGMRVEYNQQVALATAAANAIAIARADGRQLNLGNLLGPLARKGAEVQKILRVLG
jgi:hypothetical protein